MESPPKRWEYYPAWYRDANVYGHRGETFKPWTLDNYLLDVGLRGWELAGVLPDRDGFRLIFKRPLPEGQQVEWTPVRS
jgi:hypothetical protein